MKIRLLQLLIALLIPLISIASEPITSVDFMTGNETLWPQYKSNTQQLNKIATLINKNISEIKAGQLIVKIQANSTSLASPELNKRLALKRAQQLIDVISKKNNLASKNFSVKIYTNNLAGATDIAIVSLEKTTLTTKNNYDSIKTDTTKKIEPLSEILTNTTFQQKNKNFLKSPPPPSVKYKKPNN